MRRINGKDFSKPPKVLLRPGAKTKINQSCINGNGKSYNGNHYKHIDVKIELKKYSLGLLKLPEDANAKCYYCESTIEVGASLQVEHYRPKDAVDKEDTNGNPYAGYYHLGLEWTNLLLACANCNGSGAKGTRFPIKYNRAIQFNPILTNSILDRTKLKASSSELLSEGPLLINPEIQEPDTHFTYSSSGNIKGKTEEGRTTGSILKLDRILLRKARIDVLRSYINMFNAFIVSHKRNPSAGWAMFDDLVEGVCKQMIDDSNNLELTYIQWRKFICSHFILTVLPQIDINYRIRVYLIYRDIKRRN
ncbi:MAG TPA: hypothetical protein VFD77_03605 [Brumimicrobium sp.]|nr:hypothetical protein [Brumimicrobium sp.]